MHVTSASTKLSATILKEKKKSSGPEAHSGPDAPARQWLSPDEKLLRFTKRFKNLQGPQAAGPFIEPRMPLNNEPKPLCLSAKAAISSKSSVKRVYR